MINDKRKKSARVIPVALITALVLFCAGLISGMLALNDTNNNTLAQLDNIYSRSLYEAADSVNNIEMNLSKLMVTKSEQARANIASDIHGDCLTALSSVSNLPSDNYEIAMTIGFLNQLGDWCCCYSKDLVDGNECTHYSENAESLYISARQVNNNLSNLLADMNNALKSGNFKSGNTEKINLDKPLKENDSDYPKLSYDGAFSEPSKNNGYKALENKAEINEAQAKAAIKKIFLKAENLKTIGQSESPKAFELSGTLEDNEAFFSVSKNGGIILNAIIHSPVNGSAMLDRSQSFKIALDFAQRLDYKDLQPVWHNQSNGFSYVNLAPVIDGVVYYTDLVKIKINNGDKSIAGLEALGFCKNNCQRTFKSKITYQEALEKIYDDLEVISSRMAVIPDRSGECLAYEFKCSYKGLEYYVYIGAECSRQRQILRVIDEGGGEMVI